MSVENWRRRAETIDGQSIPQAILEVERARKLITSEDAPVIGVMGEFSRGKSALINALLGVSVMPVHPLPTTAVPTRISYNPHSSAWLIYEQREIESSIEEARHIVAYRTDNSDGLREIRVGLPHPLLERGVVLLDTPGIGGLDPRHHEMALRAVDELSALIFVFATDPPLSAEECDFLREVLPRIPRVLLVQSKIDLLAGWRETLEYNRGVLDSAFPELHDTPIFPLSALSGEGLAALCGALAVLQPAALRRGRVSHQLAIIRGRLQSLADAARARQDSIRAGQAQAEATRAELARLQSALRADDAAWRAELLDVVEQLPDYVLGNLSAAIYKATPAALDGKRGTALALDEIRRVRDQIANETERVLHHSRLRISEAVRRLGLPAESLPPATAPSLPEPINNTIPIRVHERRLLNRVNHEQTVKAYRSAVGRMAEEYAIGLTPLLTAHLDTYLSGMTRALAELMPEAAVQLCEDEYVLLLEAVNLIEIIDDADQP